MRGRRYAVDGEQNIASPTVTMLGVTSTAAIRPVIYEILVGSSATPADNAIEWYLQRSTAAGTSTAVTPRPLDPADPASTASAGENHTAEPTYTADVILFRLPLNQRNSHRWLADPDGGFVLPATANNGAGLYPVHASATVLCSGTIYFQE